MTTENRTIFTNICYEVDMMKKNTQKYDSIQSINSHKQNLPTLRYGNRIWNTMNVEEQ